jgi:hypothetical protein
MDEKNTDNYNENLQQVLQSRGNLIEKEELIKLKDALRIFQTCYASLYNIFLKKKLINEDPYKQETKISELEVPEIGPFNEAKKFEQISLRLSNYDNQLDFLVNFYQLGVDFLNLERIKRILGLVRFIDWLNLTPDSQFPNTRAVSELANLSKTGVDAITLSIIGESLSKISKATTSILNILKGLSIYYRECYKLNVRQNVTQSMSASEAVAANIKKKMQAALPGTPFYMELIDEIIKEDYTKDGPELKENILKILRVEAEKPKAVKPPVDFKNILLEGIQVIGGASFPLNEIGGKLDANEEVFENRKKGFMEKIKNLIRQITNAEPEEVIYAIEYLDATKGVPVKEKIQFHLFRQMMGKKSVFLNSCIKGPAYSKISNLSEEQIIQYLEKNIREVQSLHKTLTALDDFFKNNANPGERDKIKGIKPELSTLKNSIVRANQLRYEYSAQKEENDQMKRLGINTAPTDTPS